MLYAYWDGPFNMIPRLAYGGRYIGSQRSGVTVFSKWVNEAGGAWLLSLSMVFALTMYPSQKGTRVFRDGIAKSNKRKGVEKRI